jgi:hypothetical protein
MALTREYLNLRLLWREDLGKGQLTTMCFTTACAVGAQCRWVGADALTFTLADGNVLHVRLETDQFGDEQNQGHRCPSCGEQWTPSGNYVWIRAHNVIPASRWPVIMKAAIRTLRPVEAAAEFGVIMLLAHKAADVNRGAACKRGGRQCPRCETLQGSDSLLERGSRFVEHQRTSRDALVSTRFGHKTHWLPPLALVGKQFWQQSTHSDFSEWERLTRLVVFRVSNRLLLTVQRMRQGPNKESQLIRWLDDHPQEFVRELAKQAVLACRPDCPKYKGLLDYAAIPEETRGGNGVSSRETWHYGRRASMPTWDEFAPRPGAVWFASVGQLSGDFE